MVEKMKIATKKECCSIEGKGEAVDLQHWAVKLMTEQHVLVPMCMLLRNSASS